MPDAKEPGSTVESVPVNVLRDLVHDLRNPLVAALGFLHLLERTELSPAAGRYAAAARESVEALRDVVDRARAVYGGRGTPG